MRMRTFFLNLCVCLVAGSSFAHAASDKPVGKFPFIGRVVSDRVHIRSGQSNNYESVAMLNKDSELYVLGKSYSWYKVALPEGAKLFVKIEYVKSLSPEIGEVSADRVNVRARPGVDASILGQLQRGEQFFIKGTAGEKSEWYLIRPVAKTVGWVQESFVEFKSIPVAGKNYAEVPDASTRLKIDRDAAERKHSAKFSLIKAVAPGLYEAEGVLVPVVSLSGVSYKLMGGAKGDVCVAYLSGTASVFESFVGTKVIVRGVAKEDVSLDAALMTASKISLAL